LYYLYSKLKVDPFNGDPIIHYVVDIKTEVFPVNAAGNAATKAVQANFAGQFVIADARAAICACARQASIDLWMNSSAASSPNRANDDVTATRSVSQQRINVRCLDST
jgi:hypothetical protein